MNFIAKEQSIINIMSILEKIYLLKQELSLNWRYKKVCFFKLEHKNRSWHIFKAIALN